MSFFTAPNLKSEYEKNKQLRRQDVENLQQWTHKQPHLPNISEFQTLLFLQSCYYSNEIAKTALDNYFTIRTLCPDIFAPFDAIKDSFLKKNMELTLISILPKLNPDGYKIVFARLMDRDPEYCSHLEQMRYFDMTMILDLYLNGTCDGYVIVIDTEGATFGHFAKFNISIAKKYVYYLQEAMPIRLKAFHIINVVPFVDTIMTMIKPFLKKELLEIIHFHSSIDDLFKFVPKDCLPLEYGGKAESVAFLHEKSKRILQENANIFKKLEEDRVDESKRPGKPKNAGDFFGIDGTFKKLEVD